MEFLYCENLCLLIRCGVWAYEAGVGGGGGGEVLNTF